MVGAWIHGKKGTIDKQILALMFCGSLPTEVLTLIGSFASTHAPDKVVRSGISVMLALVGSKMIVS